MNNEDKQNNLQKIVFNEKKFERISEFLQNKQF